MKNHWTEIKLLYFTLLYFTQDFFLILLARQMRAKLASGRFCSGAIHRTLF